MFIVAKAVSLFADQFFPISSYTYVTSGKPTASSVNNEHVCIFLKTLIKQVVKRSQVWPFTTSRDNNFQPFVSQMCTILRKNVWSYWTVLMAWLKLITWRHWQFHLALLNRITWRYWTVLPGVTVPHHLMLLDSFTWRYWTVSSDVTGWFHLPWLNLLDSFTLRYRNLFTWRYRTAIELFNMQRPTL